MESVLTQRQATDSSLCLGAHHAPSRPVHAARRNLARLDTGRRRARRPVATAGRAHRPPAHPVASPARPLGGCHLRRQPRHPGDRVSGPEPILAAPATGRRWWGVGRVHPLRADPGTRGGSSPLSSPHPDPASGPALSRRAHRQLPRPARLPRFHPQRRSLRPIALLLGSATARTRLLARANVPLPYNGSSRAEATTSHLLPSS